MIGLPWHPFQFRYKMVNLVELLSFKNLPDRKKSKVILCVRKVFLKVVFLALQDLFSWLIFPNFFLSVCLFQLCSKPAPLFPSFPFILFILWGFFPQYFLIENG